MIDSQWTDSTTVEKWLQWPIGLFTRSHIQPGRITEACAPADSDTEKSS